MKELLRIAAVVALAVPVLTYAQDDEDFFGEGDATNEVATEENSAEGDEGEAEESASTPDEQPAGKVAKSAGSKMFSLLPFCRTLEGKAEVLKPTSKAWEAVAEGRFYPLGSCFRTFEESDQLKLQFGQGAYAEIRGAASFGTAVQMIGEQVRTVTLIEGAVDIKVPNNFPEGAFSVTCKGAAARNLAGESRYVYEKLPDGAKITIRCVTGNLDVEGMHFKASRLKAANEIQLRTANEALFTAIYGISGDINLTLDQGTIKEKNYETGETKLVEKKLEWKLSPLTAVRIHRALPDIGQKMAVTVMTFDATGNLANRCAFTEGLHEVNSGELCISKKVDSEDLAKRASEATDTEEAEVNEEAESDEDENAGEDESGTSSEESAEGGEDDLEF